MGDCTVSLNSYVTRHRAQNLRIFSNFSRVAEGIFECVKKVTKSTKMPQKIPFLCALRVLLQDTEFDAIGLNLSNIPSLLPPTAASAHFLIYYGSRLTREKKSFGWCFLGISIRTVILLILWLKLPLRMSERCPASFHGIYELFFGVTADPADLRKPKFESAGHRPQLGRIERNCTVFCISRPSSQLCLAASFPQIRRCGLNSCPFALNIKPLYSTTQYTIPTAFLGRREGAYKQNN
jgi:hypothetical protein